MPSTVTNRLQGLTTSVAVKAPVKAVSTANLTLSGEQTVNSVALVDGDRVLAKDQTDASENGIYVVSTGSWTRAKDFEGSLDVVKGTLVTSNNDTSIYYRVTSDDPIVIGTDDIDFEVVSGAVTQSSIGAALYPRAAAEVAAGVTPTNYYYPPGNIWRYGPTGDGEDDDSAAFADLIACGAPELVIENGTFSVAGTHELATNRTRLVTRNAVIAVRDETGAGGVINLTASDCSVDVAFDFNGLGVGGITVAGDRNYVKASGRDLVRSSESTGYESLVVVTGDDNTIHAEGHDLTEGDVPGAVPRVVTCQGNGSGTTIEMLKGRNVQDGLAVGAHTDITIDCIDINGCPDNPLYLLSDSKRVKVCGGFLTDVGEWAVIKGEDHEICNLLVRDWNTAATLEDAVRIGIRGCKFIATDQAEAIISTRSGNTTSSDITLENCEAESIVGSSGIAHFSTGSVNNFKLLGGHYKLTWNDETSASARIVTHATGDRVEYRNVSIVLEDEKTTPMTGSDILSLDIPDVSKTSVYEDVLVMNNTAASVREGTVGSITQANLHLRSEAGIGGGGLYLVGIDSTARRRAKSAASPTAGAWSVGDIVWNTAPSVDGSSMVILGWICTAAGSPGTWQPMRVSTVSPAT